MNDKLYLHFSPNFPALDVNGEPIAGQILELDPAKKGGNKDDSYWLLGKTTYCDIRFLPPKDPILKNHFGSISRIHATLKYEVKTKFWNILDGGVYLSENNTNPGDEVITPSRNGIWINGDRIRVNDWCAIDEGDLIHFGNDKRIVIYRCSEPTLNEEIWNTENWIYTKAEKVGIEKASNDTDKLLKHAQENANPTQKSNESLWSVVGRLVDWFIAPSKTRSENLTKLFLIGFCMAFLLSDKFQHIINWIFNR